MSSKTYAYYHAGNTQQKPTLSGFSNPPDADGSTCRQSWSTYAVSVVASHRPNMLGQGQQVTLYSTSNINNNYGIMQYGQVSNYFIFATETWYANGDGIYAGTDFNDPHSGNEYGLGANGPVFGYTNWTNVSKFNWTARTWATTGAGQAPTATGGHRGGLSTPYSKFYYGWYNNVDIYNTTVDIWNTNGGTLTPLFVDDAQGRFNDADPAARSVVFEASSIPGQDWGYWYSMWDYPVGNEGSYTVPGQYISANSYYTNLSQKTYYATDTMVWSPGTDLAYYALWGHVISGNSASGCSGPQS
jgi:hypothetical protein